MYPGTNDKDSNKPVFTQAEANGGRIWQMGEERLSIGFRRKNYEVSEMRQ